MLADENVPRAGVEALRAAGHDVKWVRTEAPGSSDRSVIGRAQREARLLLTFDKDFGELAFGERLLSPNGIVLVRIGVPSPEYVARAVVAALSSRADWVGHFSVIEEHAIRMTPMPEAGS